MHAKEQTEVSSGRPSTSCETLASCSPLRLAASVSSQLGLPSTGIPSTQIPHLAFYMGSGDRTPCAWKENALLAEASVLWDKLSLSRLSCLRTHCIAHTGLKLWQSSCFLNAETTGMNYQSQERRLLFLDSIRLNTGTTPVKTSNDSTAPSIMSTCTIRYKKETRKQI